MGVANEVPLTAGPALQCLEERFGVTSARGARAASGIGVSGEAFREAHTAEVERKEGLLPQGRRRRAPRAPAATA
ncbi:hypothetical protein LILAB_26015 [Corallococcus macrosporus]|uniref:Uncharacterized protein n=1 Tax=Myxococcus fulvus (strain ATCC BAA-855 / HW-1) TaxID=483219 RepID=F8CAP4_MYXFH|nr:hypothetical protein LILAB_26015 [Corallococcus macrosporus]